MSDDNQPYAHETEKQLAEIIVFKVLGYLLLILGVVAIIAIGYHIYELYQQPQLVSRIAESLKDKSTSDAIPFSLLKIAAWQIVIVLMLLAGKVAIWFIEAGQRLVNIR